MIEADYVVKTLKDYSRAGGGKSLHVITRTSRDLGPCNSCGAPDQPRALRCSYCRVPRFPEIADLIEGAS